MKHTEPMAYHAFGVGPRNCIGMRFSYLENNLITAKLLLRYRLLPGPRTEIGICETKETFSTRTPKNGVWCRLEPLSNNNNNNE